MNVDSCPNFDSVNSGDLEYVIVIPKMILYTWGTQGSLSVTFPFNSRVSDSSLHAGPSFTRIFEFQSALKGGHFGKWEEKKGASKI